MITCASMTIFSRNRRNGRAFSPSAAPSPCCKGYTTVDKLIVVALLLCFVGIFGLLARVAYQNPATLARWRGAMSSVLPAPDEDEAEFRALSEKHRQLLKQLHDRPHLDPSLHQQSRQKAAPPASPEVLLRAAHLADPLYHGQIFRDILPSAFVTELRSVAQPTDAPFGRMRTPLENRLETLFLRSFQPRWLNIGSVVPALIAHASCEEDAVRAFLEALDAPFRHLVLILDGASEHLIESLDHLQKIGALTVFYSGPGRRRSFAETINLGVRRSREILTAQSEFSFFTSPFYSAATGADTKSSSFYVVVDACRAAMKPQSLSAFAVTINGRVRLDTMSLRAAKFEGTQHEPVGIFYPHRISLACFAIRDAVIATVGYFNENFATAKYAALDFVWRTHMLFRSLKEHSVIIGSDGGSSSADQLPRENVIAADRELLFMIWGVADVGKFPAETDALLFESMPLPPSGRVTPFGLPGPLHLWMIDHVRERCLLSASVSDTKFPTFVASSVCWFNFTGAGLLAELQKIRGGSAPVSLPHYLREPTVLLRDYEEPAAGFTAGAAGGDGSDAFLVVFVFVIICVLVALAKLFWVEKKDNE
jgi:hypothetical protein